MKLMKKHDRNYKQWFCHQEHRTLHLQTKGKQKDILSATVVNTICQGMKYWIRYSQQQYGWCCTRVFDYFNRGGASIHHTST